MKLIMCILMRQWWVRWVSTPLVSCRCLHLEWTVGVNTFVSDEWRVIDSSIIKDGPAVSVIILLLALLLTTWHLRLLSPALSAVRRCALDNKPSSATPVKDGNTGPVTLGSHRTTTATWSVVTSSCYGGTVPSARRPSSRFREHHKLQARCWKTSTWRDPAKTTSSPPPQKTSRWKTPTMPLKTPITPKKTPKQKTPVTPQKTSRWKTPGTPQKTTPSPPKTPSAWRAWKSPCETPTQLKSAKPNVQWNGSSWRTRHVNDTRSWQVPRASRTTSSGGTRMALWTGSVVVATRPSTAEQLWSRTVKSSPQGRHSIATRQNQGRYRSTRFGQPWWRMPWTMFSDQQAVEPWVCPFHLRPGRLEDRRREMHRDGHRLPAGTSPRLQALVHGRYLQAGSGPLLPALLHPRLRAFRRLLQASSPPLLPHVWEDEENVQEGPQGCPEALPWRTEGEEGDRGLRDRVVEGSGEEAWRRQHQGMRLPLGASSVAAHTGSWTPEGLQHRPGHPKIPEEGHGTSLPPRCWDPGHLRGAAADDDTDRTARGVRRLREEAVAPEPELPPWNLERLPKEHPDQQRPGGMAPPPEPCRSHIEAALLPAAGAPEARGNEHWHHCEAGVRPQSEQNPTGCLQDNDQQAHHKLGPACERDAVSDVTTEAVRLLRAVLNVRHQTRALLRAHTLSKEIISGLLSTLALLRAHTLSKDLAYIIKNKDNKKSHNMIHAQFIYYLKYHNYHIMITLSRTTT